MDSVKNNVVAILEPKAVELLREYGLPYPRNSFVSDKTQIKAAVAYTGLPAVMKIVSQDILHKSDVGGVITGINSLPEAMAAYDRIVESTAAHVPDAKIAGVHICSMADKGEEVIISTIQDDVFGPAVMVGLGGVFVEILKDVSFRICPIGMEDALEMLSELRGYPILSGARNRQQLDINELAKMLVAISRMALEHREISVIELNPVRVYPDRVLVLDARMLTTPAEEQ